MDSRLQGLLAATGEVPDRNADPREIWLRLRAIHGEQVNIIDLYALVADSRGLQAHELPVEERERLATWALPFTGDAFEFIEGSGRGEHDPIQVVPYDQRWPALFSSWRDRLAIALGPVARRIDHIGSTSVAGLPAKPIIDVQVSVDDLENEVRYVSSIEGLGIQLRSREKERRYFRPFAGLARDVHVHVCTPGGEWERRHLLFRDYLREDAGARESYTAAKYAAVRLWSDDRNAYTDAKDAVIRDITSAAEAWAARTGWSVRA